MIVRIPASQAAEKAMAKARGGQTFCLRSQILMPLSVILRFGRRSNWNDTDRGFGASFDRARKLTPVYNRRPWLSDMSLLGSAPCRFLGRRDCTRVGVVGPTRARSCLSSQLPRHNTHP